MVKAMSTHVEAEGYLAQVDETMRLVASGAHGVLLSHGCGSYVKTIYVGYEIEGEMVAALYAHPDTVEIALALAEDTASPLLVDAGHLTWRTLPVAAELRCEGDLVEFTHLAVEAVERVRQAKHDVSRDNEFFMARKGRRRAGDEFAAPPAKREPRR